MAVVLVGLGRAGVLVELAGKVSVPTPWLEAAAAMVAGNFERAAGIYARIGSLPDEAYARLRSGERLLAAGHRAAGNAQLRRALDFYGQVAATAYLRKGQALLATSA